MAARLTAADRAVIARARLLASLGTTAAIKAHFGEPDDRMARGALAGSLQDVAVSLADLAERLAAAGTGEDDDD